MTLEWKYTQGLVPYDDALTMMQARVAGIVSGEQPECLWFLEHPPLYTAGTSAKADDMVSPDRFPVYQAGRGGQYTYHGPGQRVVYVMLDVKTYAGQDIRYFVWMLEQWMINTLHHVGIVGERRSDRIGVWVKKKETEAKIAAIGIRLKKWVSYHGISLNVCPELEHFSGIVPCGIRDYGVTSLADMGVKISMDEIDAILESEFKKLFIPIHTAT